MTVERLAMYLIESALVGFVVLGCGAVAAKSCRQPVKRISVIQWTFIVTIATPLLLRIPLASPWSFAVLPPLSAAMDQSASLPSGAEEPAAVLPNGGPTGGARETGSLGRQMQPVDLKHSENTAAPLHQFPALPAWQAMLVGLYGLAASILLVRLGIGIVARRLLLNSAAPVPATAASLLSDVGGRSGRRVRLLVSNRIHSPVTWGLWRPVVVLPAPWLTERSAAELRFALAHEWSHVERRDIASCYLALTAEFLCFYQPAFWWLRRKLALCQDHIADARAADWAAAPDDYASFLLSLARQRTRYPLPGVLGISTRRTHLFWRISMVCSSKAISRRCSFRWHVTTATAALLSIAAINVIRLKPVSADEPQLAVRADPSPTPEELQDKWEALEKQYEEFTCTGRFVCRMRSSTGGIGEFKGRFTWSTSGEKCFLEIHVDSVVGVTPDERDAYLDRYTFVANGRETAYCKFSPRIKPSGCDARIKNGRGLPFAFSTLLPAVRLRGSQTFLPEGLKKHLASAVTTPAGPLEGEVLTKAGKDTFKLAADTFMLQEAAGGEAGFRYLHRYVYDGNSGKPAERYLKYARPDGAFREAVMYFDTFDVGSPTRAFTLADLDICPGGRVLDKSVDGDTKRLIWPSPLEAPKL